MTKPNRETILAVLEYDEPLVDGKEPDAHLLSASAAFNRVKRGGLIAFFVYGTGYAVTYLSQLFVARTIGASDYGIFAYVSAWAMVLIYASTLGFDVALLRFVPVYRARRAWSLLQGVIGYARRRVAVVGTVLVIGAVVIVLYWAPADNLVLAFFIGLAAVPVVALLRVQCAVLRAEGAVVASLVPDRIVREGSLIVLVAIGTMILGYNITAAGALAAALSGALVGLLLAYYAGRNYRLLPRDDIEPEYDVAAWRSATLPLMIAGVAEVLLNRTGVIILGWLGDTTAAGVYSLAFNIALIVTLPRIAANALFAPTVSGLHSVGDLQTMQALVARTATWTLCGGGCIAAIMFALATPLMTSFGPEYGDGVLPLRVLLIAQVIAMGAGSQLYLMTMTGHEPSAAALLVCAAGMNMITSIVLVYCFGLLGAAVGTAGILLAWNAAMGYWIWRRLNLLPGILCIRKFVPKS
ncbi:lipopolysaccharide biosynthesis protein [Mesorhizobium muleiense]|nr:oligosaccharide flippase family protein [Mesorhizobium muleiense]MCF6100413.1 oligosaccharide flippase family protein [Mesorhizobium muleiense]